MKIELDHREYVWPRKRKHIDILNIKVSLDTDNFQHRTKTRIKNALKKGYYGSGSDTCIGIGIREIAKTHALPVIFCNRAHWTCGLTFHNIPEDAQNKIKEYVKSMADIAEIKIKNDSYYLSRNTPQETRWHVQVERNDDLAVYKPNALVRSEFAAILKGAMSYYQREILTKEQKEKLANITKEF